MQLKDFFDHWLHVASGKYDRRQWLLSKWEVCDGIEWPEDKIGVMVRTICEGLRLERSHVVADLGCGGGWIAERLRPQAKGVIGLDFCRDMLEIARRSGNGPWVQGSIGLLPFPAGAVDRALSYFVFLNFTDDGFVETALLDVFRIVTPGGIALIGQFPDGERSAEYDRAKGEYLDYCRNMLPLGARNDAQTHAPLRLFSREKIAATLKRRGIRHEFRPSFNPFYRPGEAETVAWRFDIVMFKD